MLVFTKTPPRFYTMAEPRHDGTDDHMDGSGQAVGYREALSQGRSGLGSFHITAGSDTGGPLQKEALPNIVLAKIPKLPK